MARIFISYRRSDSAYAAANLNDKLQEHFGRDSVFFDVDNIPLGVDFREYIGNAVGLCDVLLVIMGDHWVQSVDGQGNRRIDNPSDYVRIEIESALKRSIPIIPVLVDEAEMPSETDLPQSVQSIVFRNAAELRAGRDLRQHTEILIQGLERICNLSPLEEGKETLSLLPEGKSTSDKDSADDTGLQRISDEGGDSSELLEETQKALKGFTDKYLFVGQTIPPQKLNNAISAYAPQSLTGRRSLALRQYRIRRSERRCSVNGGCRLLA
jgi:hypothetical protein